MKKKNNMLNKLKVSKQLAWFLTLLIYLIMLLTYLIMLYWSNDNTILLQLKWKYDLNNIDQMIFMKIFDRYIKDGIL